MHNRLVLQRTVITTTLPSLQELPTPTRPVFPWPPSIEHGPIRSVQSGASDPHTAPGYRGSSPAQQTPPTGLESGSGPSQQDNTIYAVQPITEHTNAIIYKNQLLL